MTCPAIFWENICRSRGNFKFTWLKSLSFFSSRICQQFDAILLWFVEYNVLKEGLFKKRLGISRSYLKLVNWINWAFDREKKPIEFSRTVNSTVWPLSRNGSANFVCTCFDNCMIIWRFWTFWQSVKNLSGNHQRDILTGISTDILLHQGKGVQSYKHLEETTDLSLRDQVQVKITWSIWSCALHPSVSLGNFAMLEPSV